MADEYLAWLEGLPVREERTVDKRIHAIIQDAFGNAEVVCQADAIAEATAAVMALVRPYQEALERVAPAEAEALDHRLDHR